MLEERGPLPNEEGNWVRGYKAVHKDIVLSSWPLEDVEGKAEEMGRVSGEAKRRR